MPSAEAECVVCSKMSTANNIVGHIMTHKKDIIPHLIRSSDLFATVRQIDVEEGVVAKEYYCCFGCKKQYANREKVKEHMLSSDECVKKHKDFLKEIGFLTSEVDMSKIEYYKAKHAADQEEIARLRRWKGEQLSNPLLEDQKKENFLLLKHVGCLEEALFVAWRFISESDRKYVNHFHYLWHLPGVTKEYREKLLEMIPQCPLLQVFLTQNLKSRREISQFDNGSHETITNLYFDKHYKNKDFQYITEDDTKRPAFPDLADVEHLVYKLEPDQKEAPAPVHRPERPQPQQTNPTIYSKNQPSAPRSQSPYPRIINKTTEMRK